ncbi:hypothetical protein Syun_020966 [Stephania yunnanensis]|uniref:Uncharacterized protein n=1 Tax=Stephania yunnanensis TaxID=152371 RepID=A0AAP0IEU4_9MAGN
MHEFTNKNLSLSLSLSLSVSLMWLFCNYDGLLLLLLLCNVCVWEDENEIGEAEVGS